MTHDDADADVDAEVDVGGGSEGSVLNARWRGGGGGSGGGGGGGQLDSNEPRVQVQEAAQLAQQLNMGVELIRLVVLGTLRVLVDRISY